MDQNVDFTKYKKAVLPVICVLLVVFLLLIVFYRNGILDLNKKKAELQVQIEKNEALKEENTGLYREVTRLKSDQEYLEQVARKELGMIKKNEIIVKFHSDDKKGSGDAAETEADKTPENAGVAEGNGLNTATGAEKDTGKGQ